MYAELIRKKCSRCKEDKELALFYKVAGRKRPRPECKSCTNNYHKKYRKTEKGAAATRKARETYQSKPDNVLKDKQNKAEWARFKKYGMVKSDFLKLSKLQDHRCAICNKEEKLVVDHCHSTGIVRGLLCNLCNRGLGLFLDNTNSLLNAANYLNKYKK